MTPNADMEKRNKKSKRRKKTKRKKTRKREVEENKTKKCKEVFKKRTKNDGSSFLEMGG